MTNKARKLIIGDKIRRARVRAGMTQEALSRLTKIAQSQLSEIEHGNRGLKAEQLWKVAQATNKPLDYFVS